MQKVKVTRKAKVLGYIIDAHCNNNEHIENIKKKTAKANKML